MGHKTKTAFSLIFIFDNDLGIESTKIQNFIISKERNHFVTDPNIEGLFLKLKQKYNLTNDGTVQFREKCKYQFALQFKKGVDELGVRDKNYIEILGRDIGSIISNAKICPHYTALLKPFLEDND